MTDNPQPWHQEGPQNAPDPAVVEETNGEKPGLLARLWAAFNGTEEVAKGTDKIVGGMTRQALNADKMSDEAADRARAVEGDNPLPSGMTAEDVRNLAQGDRGAVRSGAASAAGGFTGAGAAAAYEAVKQYAVTKAAEAAEAVVGAGTRLAKIFRRGGSKTTPAVPKVGGALPSSAKNAEDLVSWVDEGGNLRAGRSPGMRPEASRYQASASGARSNALTGRGQVPYLEFTDEAGKTIGAKFDGVKGAELIDRKMNPFFSAKAVDQANRQAAVAKHYNLQVVWELPTQPAADAANRFLQSNKINGIAVRVRPQ
jgi:hypothetical protein